MGLQLPGELVTALSWIGFDWPDSDETALFEMGRGWLEFSGTVNQLAADAGRATQAIQAENTGAAIDAFTKWWGAEGSPAQTVGSGAQAAMGFGAALIMSAALVLALKIQIIVQLTILAIQVAQAIATAVATFGASLLEIPVFRMLTKIAVDLLVDQVVGVLLGG